MYSEYMTGNKLQCGHICISDFLMFNLQKKHNILCQIDSNSVEKYIKTVSNFLKG